MNQIFSEKINKIKVFLSLVAIVVLISFGLLNTYLIYVKHTSKNAFIIPISSSQTSSIESKYFKDCLDKTNLLNCAKDLTYKLIVIDKTSLKDIYQELASLLKTRKISSFYCHDISHKIGEYTYLKQKNLKEGFEYDVYKSVYDTNCATGYYHGLLIGLARENGQKKYLISELSKIVETYKGYLKPSDTNFFSNWKYIDMIHGVGHAVYINSLGLDESVKDCESISEDIQIRELCVSGIFMERSYQKRTVGLEAVPEDCESIDTKYRYACFTGIRSSDIYLEENYNHYLKYCASQTDKVLKYACYKGAFIQILINDGIQHENNYFNYCSVETDINEKIKCLEILGKTFYTTNVRIISSPTKIDQNLCSNFGVIDYFKCMNKMSKRKYIEMIFSRPEDKYLN